LKDAIFDVTDRVIVITGGMGQIGSEFVREFHMRGARVAIFGRHADDAAITKAFADIPPDGRIRGFCVDITKKDTINAALDEIEKSWGTPDVLINNAGLDTQPSAPPEVTGPFEDFPEDLFREVVDINLIGTFLMIQAVGKRMKAAGRSGSIINVGSIYGMVSPVQDIYAYKEAKTGKPFIKPVAYCAAKSGLYNLTRYCATYWGRDGIRVNIITPSGVFRDTQDREFQENYCARMPIGRMSQPSEYNGIVVFLASDASTYMTGANLVIDGGWTAW